MDHPKGIKYWAEEERPRGKLLQKGPAALTDAELLAILINTGTKTLSALDLAREVLNHAYGHLHELGKLSVEEIMQTKGIGKAKAIAIAAALEIGKRRHRQDVLERNSIMDRQSAADFMAPLIGDLNHEAFCVLYLNQAHKMIRHEIISQGGITSTIADIRMILKHALLCNANKIIVGHNHPSGCLQPSNADKLLTQKIADAARFMDITLIDHLIIAGNRFFSFADEGLLT